MSDRIAVPLPDGGWLMFERETFDVALVAGAELSPTPPPAGGHDLRLLTSRQLGERLGVPDTKVEEAARRDEIPSVRIGKYLRFNFDEILATLSRRARNARVLQKPIGQTRKGTKDG